MSVDLFNGTSGTLVSSRAPWTAVTPGTDVAELDGAGAVRASSQNTLACAVLQTEASVNHFAEVVLGADWSKNDTSGPYPILVRCSSASRVNAYALVYTSSTLRIRVNSGSSFNLGVWAGTISTGDTLRLEAENNIDNTQVTLRAYVNGTLRITSTDATYLTQTQTGFRLALPSGATATDFIRSFDSGALGDTTAPTLTSATGTATGSTAATGTVTTDEANGTLYRLASTNATETAATVVAAALSQTVTATGVQNVSFTGLTASTTYYAHYVHVDAASNQSARVSSSSFTTTTPDTTAPDVTSVGAVVKSNALAVISATTNEANGTMYLVTTTSATPPSKAQVKAGLNDGGTAAVFDDSQAIGSTGVKTFNATGHTALQTYYGYVVHTDAADTPNDSDVEATGAFVMFKDGATGQAIIDDTSAIPGVQEDGILVNDVELPADADKWFTYDVVTPVVDTASLTLFPNGSLIWTGTSADSFTYQLKVDGVDVGSPQLVMLAPVGPPDDEDPVLTGDLVATDITDTSYTLTWPAATDNVGVTGYEVSLNNGSSYTPVGLVLTTGVTGRTPEATDLTRVRAYDAAGNRSDFLAEPVTLLETPEPPDEIAPELSLPTAVTTGATTADATVVTDEAGGALFWVRTANLTEDKNAVVATGATQPVTASGLQSYGVTGLDPTSTGRVHTVHRDAAGNVSDTVSSAEFTTNAFGGGGGDARGTKGLSLSIGLSL